MFENLKTKAVLLNAEPTVFKNDKTGEVNKMTHIKYGVIAPTTERFEGLAILDAYANGKAFELLKGMYGKEVQIEVEQRLLNNGSKFILKSVNNINLR